MLKDTNRFFEQLFNSTQSFVALYRPGEQKFVEVNAFGVRMFEVQDTREFISLFESGNLWPKPPVDMPAYLRDIELSMNTQGQIEKEMFYQTATGRMFWGHLRVDNLDLDGEKHFLIKITDIDVFKKAESKAVRNALQFQALFNNSTMGIVITNQHGQIINCNDYAEQQFGYSKEEIIGQPVEVLVPQTFRERHKDYRESFIGHPHNRAMGAGRDLYAKRKDNTEFPVEISLSPYKFEEKNHVIAFVIDISIRKQSEAMVYQQKEELEKITAQMKQLNAELEQKVEDRTKMLKETLVELQLSKEELSLALEKERELGELKSRFVTMASHEFRTPLSTILSSSYIAQQYTSAEDQEKRNKHLGRIQHAVQTLTFILEDFLSLERLDEGHVQVKLERVEGHALIAEIESILEGMGQMLNKGQKFEFYHESITDVTTDKKLLRNILGNLVSNAIKYSPEQSIIKISTFAENSCLKISVADQGIGIPPDEQKHMFERFFRASNASNIQGTGLGLHIVNRYLKLIAADVDMKSELGKGTVFTIMININDQYQS
ncbi:MAG TPA: PAS domain-containing sensor histidine kinase [Chitinophagaceae bacterium]|nr:PAS domain-containing sensor histidine kinase [Chitinophagaceae bacterium]